MLISSMERMMEEFSPSSVNVLKPLRPATSQGLNQLVYEQMRRDFMVVGPFVLHSEIPELLAGAWSLVRETLFVGNADRGSKETIAWAISKANRCQFCIDQHLAAVKASNNSEELKLAIWAESTANANAPMLDSPPFTLPNPEYIGTAVAFHYLNRMVSVFLDKKMMPFPDLLGVMTNAMAKMMMGGMLNKGKESAIGDSLKLLPDLNASLAWKPEWAEANPHISESLAGWSSIIETVVRFYFEEHFINTAGNQIDFWNGGTTKTDKQVYSKALDTFNPPDFPCAEIVLCTVYSPYRVTNTMLQNALQATGSRKALLALVAWAAQRAARRCGDWSVLAAGNSNVDPVKAHEPVST